MINPLDSITIGHVVGLGHMRHCHGIVALFGSFRQAQTLDRMRRLEHIKMDSYKVQITSSIGCRGQIQCGAKTVLGP